MIELNRMLVHVIFSEFWWQYTCKWRIVGVISTQIGYLFSNALDAPHSYSMARHYSPTDPRRRAVFLVGV